MRLEDRNRVLEYAASRLLEERTDRKIETFMGVPIEKVMELVMDYEENREKYEH